MASETTLKLNGQDVAISEGWSLRALAVREGVHIPTLCHDDRLKALGGCRLCVVEMEGARNPVASCTTEAVPGMVIETHTPALEQHRRTLLELVVSESPAVNRNELTGFAGLELAQLVDSYSAATGRFQGAHSGQSRHDDLNPFIVRDYDACISCYRCVRVCDEAEGDFALTVVGRGFDTQIATAFDGELRDSTCTFCGQCVQTCPTGALADKKATRSNDLEVEVKKTRTICAYCGVGCSVDLLTRGEKLVGVQPAMDGPANEGALCVKGQFAYDFVQHDDRLKTPMVRDAEGVLQPASWDEALDAAADGFQQSVEKHGAHSVYGIASGRAPHEAAYTMQKFMRAGFGTNQIDNCSRA